MTTGPQGSGYEIMVIIVMAIVMAWLLGVMCGGFAMHWFVRRSIPLGTTTTTTSSTRVLMKDKETEMEAGTTSSMTSSSTLWVTAHGERFHVDAECKGLRGARSLKNVTRCLGEAWCVYLPLFLLLLCGRPSLALLFERLPLVWSPSLPPAASSQ